MAIAHSFSGAKLSIRMTHFATIVLLMRGTAWHTMCRARIAGHPPDRCGMPISYRVVITDKVQRPDGSSAELAESGSRGYEREHSECQVSGSVVVNRGGRWLATLAVPMTGEQSLLVTIERQGRGQRALLRSMM